MARSGMAASHPRGGSLGHLCSHMSTLYPFLLLMQTTEVMTVWLMIPSVVVLQQLTVKITLISPPEMPNLYGHPLQLAIPASHSFWGRGRWKATQEVICKSPPCPPSHRHSSWLKVYSHGVKDYCTVRVRILSPRNEQVSHLPMNRFTPVGSIKQVKGYVV